jgi:cell division protein FtsW
MAGAGVAGLAGAYLLLPHVTSRIDRFLDPSSGDSYQIDRSIEAFGNGGLWGTGPGEGRIKEWLPDAHADFVFAVAGEELGLIVCLVIVAIFAFIVLRGFARLLRRETSMSSSPEPGCSCSSASRRSSTWPRRFI